MKRFIYLVLVLLVASVRLFAQEDRPTSATSLTELGEKATVIVLAQVKDTDYSYRRNFPVSGSAYLKILIPYKIDRPTEIIEVYEKGLHANECYFPNPTVFEEGRRFLLFLRSDPDHPERYRGLNEGCALDVLVDSKNQYALRYPVTGIVLADSFEELAVEMRFSDPYAIEDEKTLTSSERKTLLDAGWIIPIEDAEKKMMPGALGVPQEETTGKQWIYTRGIDLMTFQKMLEPMQNR
jgi:hypothetical protein